MMKVLEKHAKNMSKADWAALYVVYRLADAVLDGNGHEKIVAFARAVVASEDAEE